jgi:hypothetical protein
MFIGMPASTTLSVRHNGRWRELGKRDSGWVGAMSFFAPWGLFITHGDERIYRDWFLTDSPASNDEDDEPPVEPDPAA